MLPDLTRYMQSYHVGQVRKRERPKRSGADMKNSIDPLEGHTMIKFIKNFGRPSRSAYGVPVPVPPEGSLLSM